MTHLDDGTLQAYLDGETRSAEAERIGEHLRGCPECAARLDALAEEREAVSRAVAVLDLTPPVETARAELRGRLAAGADGAEGADGPERKDRSAGPAQARRPARATGPGRRALARAAVLLLLVAGVAADRLPGSPVQGWIGELVGNVRSALVGDAEDVPGAATDAEGGEAESGVRVSPAAGRVRIVLTGVSPGSRIDVRLVDGSEAGVRARGGGRYRTEPGVIEVVEPGSPVRVEIPREVRSATVEVDGRVYLRKEGGRLEVAGPATDSTEAELRFRTPGGDGASGLE